MASLQIRPWREFFDHRLFNAPEGRTFQDRLSSNLVYYQANYLGVVAVCLQYVCYIRPLFLLALLLCAAGGYYLFSVRKAPVVLPINGGRVVTRRETILIVIIGSALSFLLTGGMTSILSLFFAALLILVHSSFRLRSPHASGHSFAHAWRSAGKEKSLDDLENPGGDPENPDVEDKIKTKQAEFRSTFRAQMRQKYLRGTTSGKTD
jgi:hypothetical protein